jgi:UDP-glucose 4-epimerase
VVEVIETARAATGQPIPYDISPRRPGDVASSWADPTVATHLLGWKATLGLREACEDAWRWQSSNPDGYRT